MYDYSNTFDSFGFCPIFIKLTLYESKIFEL